MWRPLSCLLAWLSLTQVWFLEAKVMMTWKQIFGPNLSVAQIDTLLLVGAFISIALAIFVLLYLYNQLADDL